MTTLEGGVRILWTIESMHFVVIPRLWEHSERPSEEERSVRMESFQPERMQERKKDSSFRMKFPSLIDSLIRRKLAAQKAETKL